MLLVEVSWSQSYGVCSQVHGLLLHKNEKQKDGSEMIPFLLHINLHRQILTLLSFGRSYGSSFSRLTSTIRPLYPSWRRVSAQATVAGPGRKKISLRQKESQLLHHVISLHIIIHQQGKYLKPYNVAGRHRDMTQMYHMLEAGMLR